MASGADIYVAFGADTGGLEAALALLNANTKATTAELNKLAREMRTTGAAADSEAGQRMKALGDTLAGFKKQASDTSAELAKMAHGAVEAGHAHVGMNMQMMESVHVAKALFDEMAAGANPMRALALEGGRIGQILSMGISAAAIRWAAFAVPVVAAGGALIYAALQVVSFKNAIDGLRFSEAQNQIDGVRDSSAELLGAVGRLGNVGANDAKEFVEPFLKLGPVGETISAVASQYLPAFIANGVSAKDAGEQLAKSFEDIGKGGGEVIANSRVLTEEEKRKAAAFVASGDKVNAYKYVLEILARSMSSLSSEQRKASADSEDFATKAKLAASGAGGFASAEDALAGATVNSTQKTREYEEELGRWTLKAQMATDQAGRLSAAMTEALKVDRSTSSIKAAEGQVQEFQDALANAKDPESIAQLNRSLEIAQDRLKRLRDEAIGGVLGGTTLERIDKQNSEIDQQNQGSRSSQLKRELPGLQAAAADPTLDAKQRQDAEEKASAMILKIRDAEFEETKALDDQRVTEADKDNAKIIAIRKKEVADAIRVYGEGNAKVVAAEEALAEAKKKAADKDDDSAAKKAAKDAVGAARQDYSAEIAEAQKAAAEDIRLIEMRVKAHLMGAQEGANAIRDAYAKEKQTIDAAYAHELAIAGQTQTQIAGIRKRMEIEDLTINEQIATNAEKAAEASTKAYTNAATSIESTWNSQLRQLLGGQERFGDAMKKILGDVVIQGIEWGEKLVVNFLLQQTVMNQAATTGAALRNAAEAAGSGSGIGALLSRALEAITASAAQTGAEVTAYMAPVTGPAAVGVGLAAQGAVASMAAFDIGAWSVPATQVALVHQNELIMPAAESAAFRSMLSGAASGGGAGQGGGGNVTVAPQMHFHNSAIDTRGLEGMFLNNGGALAKAAAQAVRDGAHLGIRGLGRLSR